MQLRRRDAARRKRQVDRHEDPPRRQAERGRHGAEAGIDGLESGLGYPEQHRDGDEALSQNHTGRGEQDFDAQCCQRTASGFLEARIIHCEVDGSLVEKHIGDFAESHGAGQTSRSLTGQFSIQVVQDAIAGKQDRSAAGLQL